MLGAVLQKFLVLRVVVRMEENLCTVKVPIPDTTKYSTNLVDGWLHLRNLDQLLQQLQVKVANAYAPTERPCQPI